MNEFVTLDGFHAIKHALRFGADITDVVVLEAVDWRGLSDELASDITVNLASKVRIVSPNEFEKISPRRHPTGIAAVARRPIYLIDPAADHERLAPAILLEDPRRLGNVGAVIRVAAGVGAAGVLTSGDVDPWHVDAIRGSAGLHFALPVARIETLDSLVGPIVAITANGESIETVTLPPGAILAFGTERDGLSDDLIERSTMKVALPMRVGVSSLNLATSVAASLYYWQLTGGFKPK